MASKQVQDLLVRLKIDGLEGLDSLKGAFRELAKTIGPTEQTIEKARQSIIEFGEAGSKSEQLIKGQIEAFKGLRSQATQGGKVYKELTANIKELESAAYGASSAVEGQRKALTALGLSADATASQIQKTINSLTNLRSEVRVDSQAFAKFSESIAALTDRFKAANQEAQNFANAQQRIARPIGATSAAARQQIRDLDLVTKSLRDQRDELGALEGEARIKAGAAGLAERGAPATGRRTFEEAVSESLFGGDIKKLLPAKDIKAALDEVTRQIAKFQQEIETKLSRKIQISFQETARAGRESARAMAAAFSDPELINVFNQFDQRLGKLPKTTAGLEQELSELTVQLSNVERGSSRYVEVSNRIAEVQKELQRELTGTAEAFRKLDIAQAGVERRSEKLASIQEYYRTQGPLAPGVGGYRDPATGAMIMAGAHTPGRIRIEETAYSTPIGPQPSAIPKADRKAEIRDRIENYKQITAENVALREQVAIRRSIERARAKVAAGAEATVQEPARRTSALFQSVAEIGLVGTMQQTELIGKSYSDVADTIQKLSAASNGSIQSLQAQRGAWQTLRGQVNPASADFRRASKEIEQLDRRLGKLQQTQSRRMSGMQMAQATGAAISGGIFGGPEGFLGGAIGGITAGVGGAFVGSAAGAQVAMLRQQLSGFADYAAQIQKMKIALEGAAGSQDQFNQAVAAANSAVRNLNVPQDVAIQGMTRLTAAVKGAGGQVSDAELVFKNVTSAIKATGGSAEDVDGAITAMVQVFSKGKVSAEELSGQLGERLPGAVTKFAKANEMTLPELQKALEQGKVGLNELMNFIVQLGDEYSGVAQQIADSSQDAGARLTVAFNDMRIAIGETLQPVGAQFQEAFAEFITDITPALVAAAKAIGEGIKFIIDNASQIRAIIEFAAKLAGVTLALKALQAMQGPVAALFLALQSGFKATSAQAVVAQNKIIGFGTTVKTVAASLAAPVVVTFAIVGAELVIRWLQRIKKARQDLIDLRKDATGEEWFANIGGKALPENQLKKAINEVGQAYEEAADNVIRLRKERDALEAKGPALLGGAAIAAAARLTEVEAALAAEEQRAKLLSSRYQAGIRNLPNAPKGAQGAALTQFPVPTKDGTGKSEADKAAKAAERERQEMLRQLKAAQDLNFEQRNRLDILRQEEPFAKTFTEFAVRRAEIQRRYNDLLKASKSEEERSNLQQARAAEYKQSSLTLEKEIKNLTEKAAAPIVETVDKIKEKIEYDREYARLLKEGITPELAQQLIKINKAYEESVKALEPAVEAAKAAILRAEAEGASATEIKKYREELEKIQQLPGQKKAEGEKESKEEADRKKREADAEEQADRLKNLYRGIVNTIEDGIVGSFMAGIDSLISGTKTLGEALQEIASGVLKDIGQMLLRFAVNLGMRAVFPGAFAAKGAYFSGGQADFAQNSIKPFAMGGIVTKPTFFKYANGGTFNNGVMGEAGPEAIMPLKRGADGKLGVAATLDSAMTRYRPLGGGAGAGMQESFTAGEGHGSSGGTAGIDVRYSVERINNVDYVTAEEFRAGMREAAATGATMGERRAMRTLQNSRSTRSRIGLR